MTIAWLIAVIGFAFAMGITPGPNNTLVASSGATYGFRASLPYNAGIGIGTASIMFIVAAFGASVVNNPTVEAILKWVGIAYLLWLAFKIATAKPKMAGQDANTRPLSFLQGLLFQFINPKIWIMITGAVVTYGTSVRGLSPMELAILFSALFGIITVGCTLTWTGLGVSLRRLLSSPRAIRIFNGAMATLLVASLIPMVIG
ncbi:LysE family translocator [uncultured Brevundimonas sp.]|uniref:LysE family translocator n=1 Tax=uncultured Brevundimonas sp. TaxID=213418 RepID=UPI0026179C59|nr:LysE family translocator [uncultured Brevundimonas sp.]